MNLQAWRRRIAVLWGNIQWHHIFGSVDRQIFDSSILLQLTWLHLFATADQTTKLALKVRWYYKTLPRMRKFELDRASSLISHQTNFDILKFIFRTLGSKPNEMHQFFFSWTVRWCFLLYSTKSRWTGWILMLWNWFLLTGTLISHNVTVVMHTGDVKLQGNGVILVNLANSVGSEPFRLFLLWRFNFT